MKRLSTSHALHSRREGQLMKQRVRPSFTVVSKLFRAGPAKEMKDRNLSASDHFERGISYGRVGSGCVRPLFKLIAGKRPVEFSCPEAASRQCVLPTQLCRSAYLILNDRFRGTTAGFELRPPCMFSLASMHMRSGAPLTCSFSSPLCPIRYILPNFSTFLPDYFVGRRQGSTKRRCRRPPHISQRAWQ